MKIITLLVLPLLLFGFKIGGKVTGDTMYRYYYVFPGDFVNVFDSVRLDSAKTCTSNVYIYHSSVTGALSLQWRIWSALGNASARIYYEVSLDSIASRFDTVPSVWKIKDSLYAETWQPPRRFFPDVSKSIRFFMKGLEPNRNDTRIWMKFGILGD